MKIGILTLPIAENYGGILQAVALYRLLQTQGHEVVLVYKQNANHLALWKKIVISALVKVPFHDFKGLKSRHRAKQERQERKAFHRPFVEGQILSISKDLFTKEDLEAFAREEAFDAVIVGSDQVWRKRYINDAYYKSYFLDFVDSAKTRKIAYAASFGKDHWEGEGDAEVIAALLRDFTAVSTREASGVAVCRDTFGYEGAEHVLDPTLLMDKSFYIDEIISKHDVSSVPRGGLVTYVLDEADEKRDIIEAVQAGLHIGSTHHLKGFSRSDEICTVPQWLAAFAYADFVVTDSFHGMVFAILFEKNFVVIANHSRGLDRFTSLLSLFGLEDRLVFDPKEMEGKALDRPDYVRIGRILDEQRRRSVGFLVDALGGEALAA